MLEEQNNAAAGQIAEQIHLPQEWVAEYDAVFDTYFELEDFKALPSTQ